MTNAEADSDEIEILRGAKVRVTTQWVIVGDEKTPVPAILDFAMVEANRRIRFAPGVLLALGPAAGLAVHLMTGWVARSIAIGLAIMAVGGMLYRDSWIHQVNVRFGTGDSVTLYRTPRLADARLFHAALAKAKEINAQRDDVIVAAIADRNAVGADVAG